MTQPTDAEVQDLMERAEAARREIQERAAALLTEAFTVLTSEEHGLTAEAAYAHIALQALEKAVLYINILPPEAKEAVAGMPIITAPVSA